MLNTTLSYIHKTLKKGVGRVCVVEKKGGKKVLPLLSSLDG